MRSSDEVVNELLRVFQEAHPTLDLYDPNLADTPARVAKTWVHELLSGYGKNPEEIITKFPNSENYDELVAQTNIPMYSVCSHHLLPFFGYAHVAYIPQDEVVGLSKLARIVEIYARRLQLQEALTEQVATCIEDLLEPLGVMVVIEARHLCMEMRGVQRLGTTTTTSAIKGVFGDPTRGARQEFLSLLQMSRRPL